MVNIVASSDHALGEMLATDPRVDQVTFTGSTATGRRVMAAAAPTLKKVFLELGGKSAFVVLDDADFRGAVGTAAFTVCTHAGQGCAITTRLVVPRDRLDEATELAAATLTALPAGDPTDPGTICGPLISARQRERVEGYLALAVDEGGDHRVRRRPAGRPAPGLLHLAHPDRRSAQLRPGWPRRRSSVRCSWCIPHDGDDDAVAIANDSPYGLSGSVWSQDRAAGPGRGQSDPHRDHRRQRRPLVQPRCPVRGLQAVGRGKGDGCGRVRGVPADQVDGRTGMIPRWGPNMHAVSPPAHGDRGAARSAL